MVDLTLLQSVSYIAGALGVCVAATYYIVNMRKADKARRREIIFRKLPTQDSYYYDALYSVVKMSDFKTPTEFAEKYSYWVNQDAFSKLQCVMGNYNLVGLLLKDKLATSEEIFAIYPPNLFVAIYERFKFMIQRSRLSPSGEVLNPDFEKPLEYLYLEAKRRYPNLGHVSSSQAEILESWRK